MPDNKRDSLTLLAHELRTPVSTIVAAATGIERGGESLSREKQHALVQLVAREAKRLARLVDDVLTASELEAGVLPVELADVEIGPLIHLAAEAAAASAPVDRAITHDAEDAVSARADADRLRQVIDNLIDNAMKHAAGRVSVTAARRRDVIRIEVADDGAGIPPAERSAIFERFHRLDSPSPGSGLGLWLAHELVTRMGGAISVEDAPAGGALFAIELAACG